MTEALEEEVAGEAKKAGMIMETFWGRISSFGECVNGNTWER